MNQFNSKHYVPILRWKQAEQTALAQLYEHDSICLTPLIELVPENFVHKDSKGHTTKLSTDEVINRVGGQLSRYWGERPFFIDLWLLPPDILKQRKDNFFVMLGRYASTLKLSLIPVTGIARDSAYQSAVCTVHGTHNQGACVRLSLEDIERATLAEDIDDLLSLLQLRPEWVDLIIDFKITNSSTAPTFGTLCEVIPNIDRWRNFIVASGAFPEDLSGLQKNDIHKIERIDWKLWKDQTTAMPSVPRMPTYSDYTIQHALYLIRKGRARYSASIRYTAEDYWLIMRGEDVFREDGPGFDQWPAQAVLLCDLPEYCAETFSEGDKYIKQMSLQRKQTGNMVTWLRAGFNHHMTFVVRQLASLPVASTAALS
jgi:hypothetical protein